MKDLEKVKKSILSAASYLFERFGYEKTSMDEIARRAHKAKASIYYHFEGKQELLKVVLEEEFHQIRMALEKVCETYQDDIREQLIAYMTIRMKLVKETKVYKHYVIAPYMYGEDEVMEMVRQLRDGFDQWEYSYFAEVCRQRLTFGDISEAIRPEAFGKMMVMLIKGLEIQFFHLEDYEALKSTYEALVELLVRNNYTEK